MCTDGRRCANCPAKRITAGPTAIAEALPALGLVVAVTANDAALLSHTGEYLTPALPGEALQCGEQRIGLRLNPGAITDVRLTPRALTLAGDNGTHRAYFTPASDSLAVQALQLAPTRQSAKNDPPDWSTLGWNEADQLTHLDALTPTATGCCRSPAPAPSSRVWCHISWNTCAAWVYRSPQLYPAEVASSCTAGMRPWSSTPTPTRPWCSALHAMRWTPP